MLICIRMCILCGAVGVACITLHLSRSLSLSLSILYTYVYGYRKWQRQCYSDGLKSGQIGKHTEHLKRGDFCGEYICQK